MPNTNYQDMPRDEFITKLTYLLKLNHESLYIDKNNDVYDYADVAKDVYDNKIVPSGDFSYKNIFKILSEYLYNQQEIDEADKQIKLQIQEIEQQHELDIAKCSDADKKFKYLSYEFDIIRLKGKTTLQIDKAKIYVYETFQPDIFACKPRDYYSMIASLTKIGNTRILAYADWYANASVYEQNTQYVEKYDEYFESLDDLITLCEIVCSVIHVDGLNRDPN